MKFGAREICDVVLKAKVNGQTIGDNVYQAGQPVIYFDSLKTTSMEQATTPVYAQGGKGNTKLVSWEGEKTITFVMEDALLSPISFAILTKANIKKMATGDKGTPIHIQGRYNVDLKSISPLNETDGFKVTSSDEVYAQANDTMAWGALVIKDEFTQMFQVKVAKDSEEKTLLITAAETGKSLEDLFGDLIKIENGSAVWADEQASLFLDYYIPNEDPDSQLITIEPETFEGNYYLEASTLFRTTDGVDLPAEFIIPNCKPQSAMTIALASTGDPSTFTFTMDAYPDYLTFDKTKKVLAAIQIIDKAAAAKGTDYNGLTQF